MHYVYSHIAENGDLLYIGNTAQIGRIFRYSTWRHEIKTIIITVFDDRWDAIAAERATIFEKRPRYNIQVLEKLSHLKLRNRKAKAKGQLSKEEILASLPRVI